MELPKKDVVRLDTLRPELAERVRRDHPTLDDEAPISRAQVAGYRMRYVEELLREEHGEFNQLEREVAESIAAQDTISENIEHEFEGRRTLGEKLSDGLAAFGGSWSFLISFGIVLFVWMLLNVALGDKKAFDPYPFILLNLVLSCMAAVQAPIIMMSQRRSEAKDRARSLNDYQVNLKAELEIRHLHDKLDHLMSRQWERMSELQRIQIELLQDAVGRKRRPPPGG